MKTPPKATAPLHTRGAVALANMPRCRQVDYSIGILFSIRKTYPVSLKNLSIRIKLFLLFLGRLLLAIKEQKALAPAQNQADITPELQANKDIIIEKKFIQRLGTHCDKHFKFIQTKIGKLYWANLFNIIISVPLKSVIDNWLNLTNKYD
ncbi:MAG: hypothetical protein LBH84_04995 [Prevotellaceae bacterium]|nr:hypothetical protein [Prevotellaceae bacterium]